MVRKAIQAAAGSVAKDSSSSLKTVVPRPAGDAHVDFQQTGPYLGEQQSQEESSPPTIGRKLPNIPGFRILRVLGRGGMGIVYEALQLALKRRVALKMIGLGTEAEPKDLDRFRLEAEAVARLQHPNIVQIHEIGEHDGHPFFSMELNQPFPTAGRSVSGTPFFRYRTPRAPKQYPPSTYVCLTNASPRAPNYHSLYRSKDGSYL